MILFLRRVWLLLMHCQFTKSIATFRHSMLSDPNARIISLLISKRIFAIFNVPLMSWTQPFPLSANRPTLSGQE